MKEKRQKRQAQSKSFAGSDMSFGTRAEKVILVRLGHAEAYDGD
jgi:hypothetical protein